MKVTSLIYVSTVSDGTAVWKTLQPAAVELSVLLVNALIFFWHAFCTVVINLSYRVPDYQVIHQLLTVCYCCSQCLHLYYNPTDLVTLTNSIHVWYFEGIPDITDIS